MRSSIILFALFSGFTVGGCSGSDDDDDDDDDRREDTDTEDPSEVTLTILSPEPGTEFAAEDSIPLNVRATRGERTVAIESATWTIGVWTGEGKETEATGIQSGDKTASVEAVVDGDTYTASVDFVVLEPVASTWTYSGTLEADVIADIPDLGEFEDHCSAPITFTLDSGVIAGSGTCVVFDDYDLDPLPFTMEGTVRGGAISGDLVMSLDGTEARTPFTGTGTAGEALSASYDTTHRDPDADIRIVGNWSAVAQ